MIEIPAGQRQEWRAIVKGELKPSLAFLAAKIFLIRATVCLSRGEGPSVETEMARQLRELYLKNNTHPDVEKDMGTIFGR